jgi:inorganic triphosphatase YgiF
MEGGSKSMEIEVRLNVLLAIEGGPAALFAKILARPKLANLPTGPIRAYEMHDIYYDTPDQKLAQNRIGLRMRVKGGKTYVTMKMERSQEGALARREEFEEPLTQERLNWVLSHISDLIGEGPFPAEDFANGKPCGSLVPSLEVRQARTEISVGDLAVVTLDVVEYPNVVASPFYDIEIEAKKNKVSEEILRQIERELYQLAGGDLKPAAVSKLQRGLNFKRRPGA